MNLVIRSLRHAPGLSVLVLLGGQLGARPAVAQTADPLTKFAGCYTIAHERSVDQRSVRLPERRVWLTQVELAQSPEGTGYVVRPAPGEPAGKFEASYWRPIDSGHGALISWTTGFDGVTLTLDSLEELEGIATVMIGWISAFSDELGAPSPRAKVRLQRFECVR